MAQLGNLGNKKVEVSAKIQRAKKINDAESRWRQQWFNAKQLVERVSALARALSSIVTAKKSVEGLPWRDNELANLAGAAGVRSVSMDRQLPLENWDVLCC